MTEPETPRGKTGARSPFEVPPGGWRAVIGRTWSSLEEDNIGLAAAGIAFYAFAALIPALGALVLSYGLFADMQTVEANVASLFAALPQEAASLIRDQLLAVVATADAKQGLGFLTAIGLAAYGASKGAGSMITALNIAYGDREHRGLVRLTAIKFAIVATGVLLALISVAVVVAMASLEDLVRSGSGIEIALIRIFGFALLALLTVSAAAALYRFGPARKSPAWVWLSPGSLLATVLWISASLAFSFYVAQFGNYGATYGSLSAVIVMLTWLWLSAYAFLVGAEFNAELEKLEAPPADQ